MNEGIYDLLPSETYHAHKESYSRSSLMDFDKSPFHYWAKHLNPERPIKESTLQMFLGSAFHALILEPHLFADQYAIQPPKVLLKNVGREIYDAYKREIELLECGEKQILSPDEMQILWGMEKSLYKNNKAIELLNNAEIEKSFFWRDKKSGLMVKSRPDILHKNMYVDLKTCSDASPRAYQREMIDYGYHIQGAMVRDAIRNLENREMNNVINICVETKYPFTTAIYIIDEEALDFAEKKYKAILLDLKQCLETNEWPAYDIQTIGVPAWAM